jgi:hypothetical protein
MLVLPSTLSADQIVYNAPPLATMVEQVGWSSVFRYDLFSECNCQPHLVDSPIGRLCGPLPLSTLLLPRSS